MNRNLAHFVKLVWSLILTGLVFQPAKAQVSFDVIVNVGFEAVLNAEWSSDSQQFAFSTVEGIVNVQGINPSFGPELPQLAWKLYDLTTGSFTSHKVWPFQPTLTPAQIDAFRPEGYIYVSPDKETWFYGKRDSQEGLKYTFANRQSRQYFITDLTSWDLNPPGNQLIKWSKNGKSAALSYINFQGELTTYFVDFQTGVTQPVIYPFTIEIDGKNYFSFVPDIDRLFGISSNGAAVLLVGRENNHSSNPYIADARLMLWKPKSPELSLLLKQINPTRMAAINFVAGDSARLFLLDIDSNLLLYNLVSGQTTVLAADLTRHTPFNAWFSPNGKWLALLVQDELRFLNISKLLPATTGP